MNSELSPAIISMLNAVLLAALPALVVAATSALLVWARRMWQQYKLEQPTASDLVAHYVKIAVEAAEQAGASKLIENRKDYAVKIAYEWLDTIGLRGINISLIEAEIERQVGAQKVNARFYPMQKGIND